jgi:hypothetical protein
MKKGKETKRSVVFLDIIRHKPMKESQHQAPYAPYSPLRLKILQCQVISQRLKVNADALLLFIFRFHIFV